MGRAHEVRAASMAKTAAAKSSKYAKWGKEIFEIAKSGVPDPEMNQKLKSAIARAKKDQCSADVIKRAIDKAKGVQSGSSKETIYEGYGNGNVAVIVECLTDNVNRTFTEVRTAFNKTGGNVGTSVSYLFNRKAKFVFEGFTEDETMEILLLAEADFEELSVDEDEFITIVADPKENDKIRDALLEANPDLEFETEGVQMLPTTYVTLDEDSEGKFRRMLGLLREIDDVQEIHHNADIIEEIEE